MLTDCRLRHSKCSILQLANLSHTLVDWRRLFLRSTHNHLHNHLHPHVPLSLHLQVPAVSLDPLNYKTSFVLIASSEGDASATTFTGERLNRTLQTFGTQPGTADRTLKLDATVKYQTIRGFGNAFTDSAGEEVFGSTVAT